MDFESTNDMEGLYDVDQESELSQLTTSSLLSP